MLTSPAIDAVIFDLDGVLTDTAEYHYQAWKRLADEEGIPFSREDNEQLRGVSRRRSLEILLKGREVSDAQAEEMMARKNGYYQELITRVTPSDLLPGVAELLDELRSEGVKIAVASASRNARTVLDGLQLWPAVDSLSDGHSVARTKPAPDLFLHAAAQLGVAPSRCLVVEDAAAGIEAAEAGGMYTLALGPAERFAEVRPEAILPSFASVRWADIRAALQQGLAEAELWSLREETLDPATLNRQESVYAIGNGYLSTRGTFEEGFPGAEPATLINGLLDGAPIIHTELANAPDWLPLRLTIADETFRLDRGQVLDYVRLLDMRDARLIRTLRWRSPKGHTIELRAQRWASMVDPHLCVLHYAVTALDFAGEVTLRAEIDGTAENPNNLLPRQVALRHWRTEEHATPDAQTVLLRQRTRTSGRELAIAARLEVSAPDDVAYAAHDCAHAPAITASFSLQPHQTAVATKLSCYHSSDDGPEQSSAALAGLAQATEKGYAALLAEHRQQWADLWADCDVQIAGDDAAQRAVRANLYHLLIAAPHHSERVSIPAKTLSGFGYRGHVFWDTEVFIVPFFTLTRPEVARNLLLYRYHTLPGARENARETGYEGARYAWESADDGRETTPPWVPLPDGRLARVWCGEIELHITADVAYAVCQYWRATGDDIFMRDYGAEIVLDTAVYWGSRAEYNAEAGRYELNDVIGPDEYHEHVNNNAFTNRLVQWHLGQALEVLAWLRREHPEQARRLVERLGLTNERLDHWRDVRARMCVPFDAQTLLFEQFEGFFDLKELDWQSLEPRTRPVQEVLGIERTQEYQALKQPDVLMLLYMLGDAYDRKTLRANWEYYEPRTDHTYGSSLGPSIHALLACRLGQPDAAYEHFERAAFCDLHDLRGNTADGIHAASAGGVWQAVVKGFGGLSVRDDGPVAVPQLPPRWRSLRFRLRHRGQRYEVAVTAQGEVSITEPGHARQWATR